jgi:UDP-N-acetyl-D-glucosamine dehydrogenase
LPLVLIFSEQRFPVTGFDIDAKKIRVLEEGGSYIYRIPEGDIKAARQRGFRATADYSLIEQMDAVVICVPTPLDDHQEPDLSYITATVESIAPHLRAGQLVVLESHLSRHDRRSGGAHP